MGPFGRSEASITARMTEALQDYGSRLVDVDGIGPVLAVRLMGRCGRASQFPSSDAFANYAGVAPVEVSSGERAVHLLSRSGDRKLNSALHLVAVTQARMRNSAGRRYYDRKISEGKTHKTAMRCLKRKIASHVWRLMLADERHLRPTNSAKTPDPRTQHSTTREDPCGGPDGIRTRVSGLKGRRPRPLDDGARCGGHSTTLSNGSGHRTASELPRRLHGSLSITDRAAYAFDTGPGYRGWQLRTPKLWLRSACLGQSMRDRRALNSAESRSSLRTFRST